MPRFEQSSTGQGSCALNYLTETEVLCGVAEIGPGEYAESFTHGCSPPVSGNRTGKADMADRVAVTGAAD